MELYKVVKQIGRGNYGSVYLVESLETGEPLCLKKISFFGMSDSEKDAAKQEVALLSSLRHPCIVRYVDSFIQDSTLHIVMQMCEGGDLASRIKAAKRAKMYFEEGQILDWLCQLAFAVAYIHKRRVLHRDLKTQNVFLTSNNLVRLGDFGIARVLEHTFENARTVVGTPYYMSPEVCENKDYNAASDMWALGCVLYEMCTLQHAFSANNLLGLVYKIVQEAHPPIPSHYTEDMRNLVNAMLSKNPHERYEAEEILELPFVKARLEKLALQLDGTTAGAKTPAMRPNQKKSNSSTTTSAALASNMSNDNSSSGENGGDNLSSSAAASSSSPERIEESGASASVLSPSLSMEAGLKPLASLPSTTSAPSEALVDVAGVDVNKQSLQGDSVTSSPSISISIFPSTSINDSSSAAVSLPVPQFDTNTSANSATNSSNQPQNTSQTVAALSQPPGIRRSSSIVTPTHHGLPLSPNASPIKQHGINGGSPTSASFIAPSSSTSSSTSSMTITNGSSSTVGISLSPLSGGKAPRSRRPSSLITSPQPVTSSPLAPLSPQPVGYSSSSSSSSSSLAPLSTPSRRGSGVTPIPGLLLSPPSTHSSNNGLAPLQLAGYANGVGGSGGAAAGSSSSRSLDTAGSSSTNTTDRGNGGFLSPGWAPSSTPVHSITSPYSKYSQVGSGSSRNSNGSGGGGGGGSGLHQNDAFVIDRQQRRPSSSTNDLPHTSNGSTSTPSSSRRASAISSIVNAARIETAMADAQEAAQMSNNQRRSSYLFSNAISSSPPPFLSSSSSSMYVDSARRNSKTSSGVSMNSPARQGGGTVVHKLSGAISASRELNLNQDSTSFSSSYSSPAAVVTENEAAAQQHSISSQQHVNVINRPASSSSLPQILPPITIGSGGSGRTSASSRVSSAASSEHRKQLIYNNNVGIAGDDDPSDRWQGEEEAEREAVVEAEKRRRRMMIEKRRSSKTIHNLHTDDEGNAIMAFGSEGYDDDDNDKDGGIENEVDDAQNIVDVDNGFNNHHELPQYISRPVSTGSGYLSDGFSDDGFEENLDVDAIHKNRVATEEVENIMAILAEDEHSLHTLQAIAQVYLKQGDGGGGGGDGSMTGRSSILLPRRSSSRAGVGSSISTNSEPSSSGLKTPSRPPARSSSSARLTDDPTTMIQTPVSSTRESLVNTPMPSSSSSSSSSTMTTTPVVPVMSSSPMQQTQKRSLDVTPKKSTGGGGGGMLSPDTFQKIKHTYLDTPSATPVVVSSHTTMQRAPSYFMAQQSQQQQQLEQPSSLVSASTTTKGASSAIYSRAHVDALRAKCRASLGPAVFQNVEAFLREQRATTGSGSGGGGGGAQVVLSQNKIRRSLLAIILDKNLLPLCSQVAEMLHMESVVLANELKSSY